MDGVDGDVAADEVGDGGDDALFHQDLRGLTLVQVLHEADDDAPGNYLVGHDDVYLD